MTPRQAACSVAGIAAFGLGLALLFLGQSYLEKSRMQSAATQEPVVEELPTSTPRPTPLPGNGETEGTLAATGSALSGNADGPPNEGQVIVFLKEAFQMLQQKRFEEALTRTNEALKISPENASAYELRGSVYASMKRWDDATKDYRRVLQISGKNVQVEFDLAELDFMQKKYDTARSGFAALADDSDTGDLASYKVFLCDLWGGHDARAGQELETFNKIGANPSYYFANAASALYRHQTEEARGWLSSAGNIYSAGKFQLYAASLLAEGYLPLPPASK